MTTTAKQTAAKTTAAAKKAAESLEITTAEIAPAKPRFLVIGKDLFAQTSEGELVLKLSLKFGVVRKLMNNEGASELDEFDFLMDNVFSAGTTAALNELEWEEAFEILMEYMEQLQKSMGASLGKFGGSSAS